MSGITTGILCNALPLSAEHVKSIEKQVLENQETFAYIDENSELCFSLPSEPTVIKDLAWNNAYELISYDGTLTKKAYRKDRSKSFYLDKTFTKLDINATWNTVAAEIFEFDGDTSGRLCYYVEYSDAYLVRVSDRVFNENELVGSTLTGIEHGRETSLQVSADFIKNRPGDVATIISIEPTPGFPFVASIPERLTYEPFGEILPGTYFLYIPGVVYIKSISCLTTADALYPTERLEGDGQEFYTTAPSTLSFRSTAPLDEFQDVQINGQTVDPSNYTLEEGSTIVKLSQEYLKTLDVGSYELSVVSNSKTACGVFSVNKPEMSEYGFYYNQPYSLFSILDAGTEDQRGLFISVVLGKQLTLGADSAYTAYFIVYQDFSQPTCAACIYQVNDGIITLSPIREDSIDPTMLLPMQITQDGLIFINPETGELFPTEFLMKPEVVVKIGEMELVPVATDGTHIYVLFPGDSEEGSVGFSYSVFGASLGMLLEKWTPIQATVNDTPIKRVMDNAYTYSTIVQPTIVDIPEGVTHIGNDAFAATSGVLGLRLPSTITSINSIVSPDPTDCDLLRLYIDNLEHWCSLELYPNLVGYCDFQSNHGCSIYIGDQLVTDVVIPDTITIVPGTEASGAFSYYKELKSLVLPSTTTRVTTAFYGCENLTSITYKGTMAEWAALEKVENWNYGVPATYVQCSDGQVAL